ncbi:MAG: leucine-rich repeat domain-containing protein [Muribaculaceae bacterium]|nr:leucine-rich repeat domain-containing protein [Muribaculaceae bacterium]
MRNISLLRSALSLAAVMLAAASAFAYDFMVGGLCYNINSGGTTVSVTYQFELTYYNDFRAYSSISANVTIPETVSNGGKTYKVTAIGDEAFRYCKTLKSATIPSSVKSIGNKAFWQCTALESVSIPGSVTSLGEWAFCWCSSLKTATLPNSVTSIGTFAFYQ